MKLEFLTQGGDGTILSAEIGASSADYVAIVDSRIPQDEKSLDEIRSSIDATADVNLIRRASDSRVVDAWMQFPARFASLVASPRFDFMPVFERSSLLENFPLDEESNDPVWDRVIRAARDGLRIVVSETSIDVDDGPSSMPLPDLAPASPGLDHDWLRRHLDQVDASELVSHIASEPDALALKAGLYQLHDFLDESHECAQEVEGSGRHVAGDYWHAIMHRREPDASNSKYWFRRVGRHPIFADLPAIAAKAFAASDSESNSRWSNRLADADRWEPDVFVDFCEECRRRGDGSANAVARRIQHEEMQLLLQATYADASG